MLPRKAREFILSGNTLKGIITDGQALVRFQNGFERLLINGNIVVFDGVTTSKMLLEISGVVTGNHFDGGNDRCRLINMERVIFSGNIVENCSDAGIDAFGTVSGIISDNIFENITGLYIRNFGLSAIKIDVDNVKN